VAILTFRCPVLSEGSFDNGTHLGENHQKLAIHAGHLGIHPCWVTTSAQKDVNNYIFSCTYERAR
jgi:hypothetical protein